MVTRGECFWVACNRLIIRFFCVYVVRGGGGKVVSDGSCVCHRCIVLLLFRGVHGLMATRLYPLLYRGAPLHKASNIYLPVLIPSSIWRC